MFARVTRYLLLETLSGLAIVIFLLAFGLGIAFYRMIRRRIQWLIDSHEVQALSGRLAVTTDGQLLEV